MFHVTCQGKTAVCLKKRRRLLEHILEGCDSCLSVILLVFTFNAKKILNNVRYDIDVSTKPALSAVC